LGFKLPLGSLIKTQRMGTAGIPVLYQTAAEVTQGIVTRPYQSFISTVCRVRVIHQRFQSRQSLAHLPGRPIWSDEAVLDTVEHLNASDDMHWPAHLAQCPQQFQCSKATIGNHNHRSPRQPSPHLPYHLAQSVSCLCR